MKAGFFHYSVLNSYDGVWKSVIIDAYEYIQSLGNEQREIGGQDQIAPK